MPKWFALRQSHQNVESFIQFSRTDMNIWLFAKLGKISIRRMSKPNGQNQSTFSKDGRESPFHAPASTNGGGQLV
jgi:hypothetical protein